MRSTTGLRRPFRDLLLVPVWHEQESFISRLLATRDGVSVNDYGVVTQSVWMVWRPFRPHSSPVSALVSSSGSREDAACLIPYTILPEGYRFPRFMLLAFAKPR